MCHGYVIIQAYVICVMGMLTALRHSESYQRQYIEARDNEGSTALLLAVQNGSLEVCSWIKNILGYK